MTRNLCTVSEFEKQSPFSAGQIRWMIFQADYNGLKKEKAVIRVGRRVYIDTAAFDRWLDLQQAPRVSE